MRRPSRRTVAVGFTVAAWAVAPWVIWVSVRRGRDLQRTNPEIFLGAAPLVGRNYRDGWDWRFGWSLLGAIAIALLLTAACWRGWWLAIRLRWVAVAAVLGSMSFGVLLALVDGSDGLLYGAEDRSEYLSNLPITPPAGAFLRTFVGRLHTYSVHVRGHPPGFVLLLKLLDWVGIGGAWATAMLSVLATGLLSLGVLTVVHAIAGQDWARRCAPYLVVSPYLIWMITSADAVYTATGAIGIAAIAVGIRQRRWVSAALGMAGGLALGGVLFGTYLGAVLLIVPIALLAQGFRHRAPGVVPAAISALVGGIVVTGGFRAAGFWWFDGVSQTKREYLDGTAQFRLWSYFGFANIAVALIALGPATFAGLLRLRDRRVWMLVAAAMVALLVSHLSQYTKGEVERIWLLFYPWIAVAGASLFVPRSGVAAGKVDDAALVARRHGAAVWVGIQASSAIVLQAALVTKW